MATEATGAPRAFPTAAEDAKSATIAGTTPQTRSPSYRLAYSDPDFLLRDEVRPVRLQLELLKTELTLSDYGINHTVVVFGSSRIHEDTGGRQTPPGRRANGRYYDQARAFAAMISEQSSPRLVVATGGGPGIMQAANQGAHDVGAESIGLNIVLPHEQTPNPYATPELSFQFHYFAIRKMHFLMRACALVVFPGGFGTMDELFEMLTLIQTKKIKPIPIILFGEDYWRRIVNFDAMAEEGVIDKEDLDIFQFVDRPEDACSIIWDAAAARGEEQLPTI